MFITAIEFIKWCYTNFARKFWDFYWVTMEHIDHICHNMFTLHISFVL